MREKIISLAKENNADIVGFAASSRFCGDDPIFKLLPSVKTVIGLGFRVLRGAYRGIEEGSTYYQYTTMGVENMEETIMPMAALRVSVFLENEGFTALPQRRHGQIMADENDTDPEVDHKRIYRNITAETEMNFIDAAVKCGLGEKGLHGALLTDEFGPFVRYCFILTDAELDETPEYVPHLCDRCGKCIEACPGRAISSDGKRDNWRCAVYYSGANGTKNPFMPPDAFADFSDRIDIIAGEAEITPEKARNILDSIYFYPPVQHAYTSSICGRACDIACYVHLEEKGVLSKKFKSPFRVREPWKFNIEDFKV
jgi:epoxyqueuosine reductase